MGLKEFYKLWREDYSKLSRLVALICLLICGLGVGGYFLYNKVKGRIDAWKFDRF